ncbi:hypothetical protein SAMN05421770_101432 [Granulicella rosea]|uniref:Uncharacterized protein n=1 Tax=Granulicella rosea TaxID=474952 RepID=A0A239DES4_9BACT|nr:hypothetical protein [Granulicella rosea]SNS30839.1 hypothetical protein SAMN05421770_101432 [Granulicella rosea]
MLDVHPPHSSVHGWRDFFIHIATITIGLVIALGLEGSVEWMHHRHLVAEARENIHHELEQNSTEAKANTVNVQADADNMKVNMQKARAYLGDSHALDNNEMHFTFKWSSFNDSAWRSARDTGALTYMPTEEVQSYADAYNQQELVDTEAVKIFTAQVELAAPLVAANEPGKKDSLSRMSQPDAHELMIGSARMCLRLMTLKQLIEQLDKEYATTLHK